MNQVVNNISEKDLMKTLQIYSFALADLTEYLDTHPQDTEAIALYQKTKSVYDKARMEFSNSFYPILPGDSVSPNNWNWATGPMPWQ